MSNTFRFAAGGVLPIMWTASHRIAKHIHNRIPDSKGRHAPLALTTGYTQNIGYLRKPFCKAIAINPSEHQNKHGKRTITGWFLGYPEGRPMPCYLIYNEQTKRIFCTADVIFDETVCLGNKDLFSHRRRSKPENYHNIPHLDDMPEAEIMPMYDEEVSENLQQELSEPTAQTNDSDDSSQPIIFSPTPRMDSEGNIVDNPPPTDPTNFVYPQVKHPATEADKELAHSRLEDLTGNPTHYPHLTATSGDINMAPVSLWDETKVYNFMTHIPQTMTDAQDLLQLILTNVTEDVPRGYAQATTPTNKPLWLPPMHNEFDGFELCKVLLLRKRVDVLRENPDVVILARWVWVYSLKYNQDGEIQITSRKARLSLDGSLCIAEIHYNPDETSSVVMTCAAFRLILIIAAKFRMQHRITDFVKAFLHAEIDRELYAEVPPGYLEYKGMDPSNPEDLVCKVCMQVYGIPQANYFFSKKLFNVFRQADFQPLRLEPAVYFKHHDTATTSNDMHVQSSSTSISSSSTQATSSTIETVNNNSMDTTSSSLFGTPKASFEICSTHVDDLSYFTGDIRERDRFFNYITQYFQLTDQTEKRKYLGKEFAFNADTAAYHLSCKGILIRVMNKLQIKVTQQSKPKKIDLNLLTAKRPYEVLTPEQQAGLDEESRPKNKGNYSLDQFDAASEKLYRNLIGVGNYIVCQVRPDCSVEQSVLAKYTSRPERRHMEGITQLLRNMIITIDYELQLGGRLPFYRQPHFRHILPKVYQDNKNHMAMELVSFTDSSLHNHVDDRNTQMARINCLDASVYESKSYHCQNQLDSSRDAELTAISDCKPIPQRALEILNELRIPVVATPVILTDSKGVMDNIAHPHSAIDKAYLDYKLQQLKTDVKNDTIIVHKIDRSYNLADALCKTELDTESKETRKSLFFAEAPIHHIPNSRLVLQPPKPTSKKSASRKDGHK